MDDCFNLLHANMHAMYCKSQWGWDEASKRKDLSHPLSRYLVCYDVEGKVAAFANFRFEMEYDVNSDGEEDREGEGLETLYLYELQVLCHGRH